MFEMKNVEEHEVVEENEEYDEVRCRTRRLVSSYGNETTSLLIQFFIFLALAPS